MNILDSYMYFLFVLVSYGLGDNCAIFVIIIIIIATFIIRTYPSKGDVQGAYNTTTHTILCHARCYKNIKTLGCIIVKISKLSKFFSH